MNPALPKIPVHRVKLAGLRGKRKSGVKTIVVSGAHSGIGKTLFAQELLRRLKNWSALKITLKHKNACPRKQNPCGVCEELTKDFEIVKAKKIITQDSTDTARLLLAGAKEVLWLKTTTEGLEKGLKKALTALKPTKGVVIEGTSVLKYIDPDLTIYLQDKQKSLRPQAKEAKKKADLIIDVKQ